MKLPLETAAELYDKHDGDFSEAFKWHLGNGVVISTPTTFLLGFWCKREQPREPVEFGQHDCIHVTMCVGDMYAATHQIVNLAPFIAFERQFKNDRRIRVIDFKKFYQKLKWAAYSQNLKHPKSP